MAKPFKSFSIGRRVYVYKPGTKIVVSITGQIYSDSYMKGHPVDIYIQEPKKKKPTRLRVNVANTRKFGGNIYSITRDRDSGTYKTWGTYIKKTSQKISFQVKNSYRP